jgi:hypothetical protein
MIWCVVIAVNGSRKMWCVVIAVNGSSKDDVLRRYCYEWFKERWYGASLLQWMVQVRMTWCVVIAVRGSRIMWCVEMRVRLTAKPAVCKTYIQGTLSTVVTDIDSIFSVKRLSGSMVMK